MPVTLLKTTLPPPEPYTREGVGFLDKKKQWRGTEEGSISRQLLRGGRGGGERKTEGQKQGVLPR